MNLIVSDYESKNFNQCFAVRLLSWELFIGDISEPNHYYQLFRDCLNGEVNSYPWCSRQESNLRWRLAFMNIAVRVPKAHTFYSRCLTT